MIEMLVKSIKIDESNRIVVLVQEMIADQFLNDEYRKMIKEMTEKALGEDFRKLEVSKKSFRVTVAEGTEEVSKQKIEDELKKYLEMAMSFMSQMNKDQE